MFWFLNYASPCVCCSTEKEIQVMRRITTIRSTTDFIYDGGPIILLTPWCRVLLEKLTGLQLVKKLPAFNGTRRFITALTNVRHLSLSWASPIQSIYPHPTSWRSILILSTHLRLGLPSGLLPSGFPTKILYTVALLTHTRYMPSPSHSSRFYHPHNIGWAVQII